MNEQEPAAEVQAPVALPPPAEPHSRAEVAAALAQPLRLLDLGLAVPERLAANLARRQVLGGLAASLLAAAILFALPYGLVYGPGSWWRIVPLYLGSTAICLPSLQVFSTYLGLRVSWAQTTVLALCIPAAAALFTFGFAPILGFLRLTMDEGGGQISWQAISRILLAVALVAGVGQLWRCALRWQRRDGRGSPGFLVLVALWHAVLLYVLLRMADLLGLLR